ncbi:MAG: integral rane sensor signal transduction histidine kinase [Fibrobacteres bacterium]|nr:integral rane sensor signal transduction histidine kinase [Fibrobacterota bacterium]
MSKIIHTLRFQLPAVVVGVFVGILFLLMLFFHEMTIILVKTRQLAESAEVNDYVVSWLTTLSSSARERTKLMSLGNESYLRSFQVTLNEVNDLFREIERIGPESTAVSTRQLHGLHDKHLEYMELLDGFAKDQTMQMLSNRARADSVRAEITAAAQLARASRLVKSVKPPSGGKRLAKAGKRGGRGSSRKPVRGAIAARRMPAVPRAAVAVLPDASVKQIELDSLTNETFKAYEQVLREGLFTAQETMRGERKDKLHSLRNSVGRAKDRLIYSLLLLLVMVGYVAVILKWKILDPMKTLKQGAVEIGMGHLGYQVKIASRNEIGELAEVFNAMSVQLDQKRNAEMRLKRLEAIEQIVRSVNHEINNPLMIISGNAEYLLAIMEQADDGLKSKLNSIVSEVRRIFMVTQRLKEIKEPVTEDYIGTQDQMIDLLRSSQIRQRDY